MLMVASCNEIAVKHYYWKQRGETKGEGRGSYRETKGERMVRDHERQGRYMRHL